MKPIKLISAFIASAALMYLCSAFIAGNFDSTTWDPINKTCGVFAWLWSFLAWAVYPRGE